MSSPLMACANGQCLWYQVVTYDYDQSDPDVNQDPDYLCDYCGEILMEAVEGTAASEGTVL